MYVYFSTTLLKLLNQVKSFAGLQVTHKLVQFKDDNSIELPINSRDVLLFNLKSGTLEISNLIKLRLKKAGKYNDYRAYKLPKHCYLTGADEAMIKHWPNFVGLTFASPKTLAKVEAVYNALQRKPDLKDNVVKPAPTIVVPVPPNTPLYDLAIFDSRFAKLVTTSDLLVGFSFLGKAFMLYIDYDKKERLAEIFVAETDGEKYYMLYDELDRIVLNFASTVLKVVNKDIQVAIGSNEVKLSQPLAYLSNYVAMGEVLPLEKANVELKTN